jgi:hypothetical protein
MADEPVVCMLPDCSFLGVENQYELEVLAKPPSLRWLPRFSSISGDRGEWLECVLATSNGS